MTCGLSVRCAFFVASSRVTTRSDARAQRIPRFSGEINPANAKMSQQAREDAPLIPIAPLVTRNIPDVTNFPLVALRFSVKSALARHRVQHPKSDLWSSRCPSTTPAQRVRPCRTDALRASLVRVPRGSDRAPSWGNTGDRGDSADRTPSENPCR